MTYGHFLNQPHMQDIPHWTEQFQSVGVGLGAFLAGLGGLKIGLDWLEQARLKRKVSRLLQRYPVDKLNKEYRLVETEKYPQKWWLLNETDEMKYWVRNLETTRDLGWVYAMVKRVPDKELDKYEEGKPINTREL